MIFNKQNIRLKYPVLLLADIHIPFQDRKGLNKAIEMVSELSGIGSIFYAGDTFDFYSFSNYNDELRDKSIFRELKKIFLEFAEINKIFKKGGIGLILGNHERRLTHWSEGTLKTIEFLDLYLDKEIKIIPYDNAVINNKWRVFHPKTCRLPLSHANTQKQKYPNEHILIAHQHRWAASFDKSGKYHLIDLPTMADIDKFEYVKNMSNYGLPNKGVVVLLNDNEYMFLNERLIMNGGY